MKKICYFLLFFLAHFAASAQSNGELKGIITDSTGTEPISYTAVQLFQDSVYIAGTSTGDDGSYLFSGISPGNYFIRVSGLGYATRDVAVSIKPGTRVYKNVKLYSSVYTMIDIIVDGSKPIIEIPKLTTVCVIDPKVLVKAPVPGSADLLKFLQGGFQTSRGQLSFKGARPSQTAYYLGAMPMLGNINFSPRSLGQLGSMINGISSEYGDFVGGAVVQNILSPSVKPQYTFEYMSSSLFDKYHFNQLDANMSGPLVTRLNKDLNRKELVLGYFMNINYRYQADPSPSALGVYKLKDDVQKQLEQSPIVEAPNGSGYIPRAELITANDMEWMQARQNADAQRLLWTGKLDYRPGKQSKLEFSWVMNHSKSKIAPYASSLFNAASNPISKSSAYIGILNYEQNLLTQIDSTKRAKNKLTRLRYAISAHYQHFASSTEDEVHGKNYFDYGYIGRFKNYREATFQAMGDETPGGSAKAFYVNGDTVYLARYMEQNGYRDTLYTFDRSTTKNPLLANYTSAFYDLQGRVNNLGEIRNSNAGLVNGMNPIGIYSNMWTNVGTMQVGSSINSPVSESQSTQYSFNAKGEVSFGMHNIKLGLYMDQRVYRSYQVNAMGLWQLMYQSANAGLNLDKDNPILQYNEMGVFQDTVRYNQKFGPEQSQFSKRLREELMRRGAVDAQGNPITANLYIDVNSLSPEDFNLNYFSANELLGTGGNNQFVKYYGYDHLGNKQRGNTSISDFLNNTDRQIGAFKPIYAAAYVEDMIEYKDLIIRMGLRFERFDANQPVLRDPFSLYPIRTAGEVKELQGTGVSHPGAIGDDYAVYVDDVKNPTKIIGYRDGFAWYNAEGQRVNDPAVLASKTSLGTIQPYLVDAENEVLTEASFKDYDVRNMVLPRFAVDFPLSEDVKLYANYDVLAQRPSNIFTPIDDYFFLRYNPTNVINNPDLKPQITTDYEIGMNQRITENIGFNLAAAYREQRNMIQLQRFNYAYPYSYTSFGNIDFSTVKMIRSDVTFRNRNMYLNAGYTFQIATGTGSGPGSQQGLVSAGQPNLRSLFPLDNDVRHLIRATFVYDFAYGKEYKGITWKGKQVLKNAGVSVTMMAFSGVPYTANQNATANAQRGVAQRSPILGTPNGSRMPWQLENNFSVYKSVPVKLGEKDDKVKMGELIFTLNMENFLNLKNIQNVHPYSGSASTDGYLSSAVGQSAIESAVNAQSFVDLYNTALANPGYYGLPRRTRLSVSLTF